VKRRYFTLAEARAALPKVKALMDEVQLARAEILRLQPEVWPALRKAAGNGGSAAAGEMLRHFTRLEAGVKGILGMGVLVKDIDMGLVDFLAWHHGKEICLCWRHGEADLLYWHDLHTGFAGRQLIKDQDFEE
jgi:hypothetical protein